MLTVNFQTKNEDALGTYVFARLLLDGHFIGEADFYLIYGGENLASQIPLLPEEWIPKDTLKKMEFDGKNGFTQNICFVNIAIVYEGSRGNGYSKFLFEEIERYAQSEGFENIIIQPFPLDYGNEDVYFNNVSRLTDFYKRLGYVLYETKKLLKYPYYYKIATAGGN